MKIRIHTPYFPFPPDAGNHITIYSQIAALAGQHDVEVVSWLDSGQQIAHRKAQPSAVAFRTDAMWWLYGERSHRSCHESKLKRLCLLLVGQASNEVLYYPQSILREVQLMAPVDLEIFHHSGAYAWLANWPKPAGTRRICMIHDNVAELFRIRAKTERWPWLRLIYRRNAELVARHEAALCDLTDELWFVSPLEADYFKSHYQASKLRIVSPTFDVGLCNLRRQVFLNRPPNDTEMPIYGLIGDLRHKPNLVSLLYVLNEVCPQLSQRGFKGEIHVVGRGASPEIMEQAKAYPFVRIFGFIPDLEEFWQRLSFMLVPHVQATGVRMKLLEALACGIPVLANQAAIDCLHADLRASALLQVRDESAGWADFMCGEPALSRRRRLQGIPIPDALDGRKVLDFLSPTPQALPGEILRH